MKNIFLAVAIILTATVTFGQNSVDVLRYSQNFYNGSARFNAMGGAFGALGGDFSALAINPAGIAIYRTNEFIFTPSIYFSKTNTKTNDWSGIGNKNNFNLNSIGMVSTKRHENKKGWKSFNFGFGLNRLNNFNREVNIQNQSSTGNLIMDYQTQAYGLYPNQLNAFTTDLAWKSFLLYDTIRTANGTLAYTSALANRKTEQTERVYQRGSMNELSMTFGGSYEDKLYIGGAIGFVYSRFYEEVRHAEYDVTDSIADFDYFVMNRYLETKGSGVNLKLGFIYRPIQALRFGVSFQTPTWFNMSDYYHNDMIQYYDNGGSSGVQSSPDGSFNYRINTPMKLTGSVGVVIGKLMLFDVDVEYLDYREGYLNSDDYGFFAENEDTRLKLNSAMNVRGGLEIRLAPMMIRLGIASYGNPYQPNINDFSRIQYSGGIGFRDENLFVDLAYSFTQANEDYYMFDPVFTSASKIDNSVSQISATIGFKF